MTVEQMIKVLGIGDAELEVLKAQDQTKSLPGHYGLEAYLIVQMLERQFREWVEILNRLMDVQRKATTMEKTEVLHEKLRTLLKTL